MSGKKPIPFRGFDEQGPLRYYYHGIMPHWRQAGCTYFVMFRLADSIPESVMKAAEENGILWLKAKGIDASRPAWEKELAKQPMHLRREYERLMGTLLNRSLDECHSSCVLRDEAIAQRVAEALDYFHGSRVLTGDFVIMPNHVHALLRPLPGFELEDILHSVKSYTANEINRMLGRTGQLWQRESYDHIVRDWDQLSAFQEYIAGNPDKAKLRQGEFILSRAVYEEET